MMENIEQNLNNSANEVFANSYSNLNNKDFFYDTKEDEFIDPDNADSSKNSFSENEVNKVGFSSDVISALQSKVEDAINNENILKKIFTIITFPLFLIFAHIFSQTNYLSSLV